jgi:hypothetical protein
MSALASEALAMALKELAAERALKRELLEALIAVLSETPGTKNARTEAARAAIAKATGEAA